MHEKLQEFVPEKTPGAVPKIWLHVGHKFMVGDTEFIIRKITRKDIVCRPVAWVKEAGA